MRTPTVDVDAPKVSCEYQSSWHIIDMLHHSYLMTSYGNFLVTINMPLNTIEPKSSPL